MAIQDVASLIRPGSILWVTCHFCNPPKEKFLVVAATTPFAVGFFINSNPTSLQQKRPDLMAELVSIQAASYPRLLVRDSYIDCSQVIQEYEMEELVAIVATDPAKRIKGSINSDDGKRVGTTVAASLQIEGGLRTIILNEMRRSGLID